MWSSWITFITLVVFTSSYYFDSESPSYMSYLNRDLERELDSFGYGGNVEASTTYEPVTMEPTTQAPEEACESIFSCADCSTARICRPNVNGAFTFVRNVVCPSTAPYCDYATGTCTTVPGVTCGDSDETFLCLRDGIFPDFKNSSVYHVCENLTASKFVCATAGESFNAVTSSCSPSKRFVTFTCKEAGKKVPYNIPSAYYGYCSTTIGQPTVIDKCPGSYQLNVTSQECEALCLKPGVLPKVGDCNRYYKCDYLWITDEESYLVKTLETCPPNTTFHPDDFICVDESLNPVCATEDV